MERYFRLPAIQVAQNHKRHGEARCDQVQAGEHNQQRINVCFEIFVQRVYKHEQAVEDYTTHHENKAVDTDDLQLVALGLR